MYGPHEMLLVEAWLAGEPVTVYEQSVTGLTWVSTEKDTVQEVSAALQVLLKLFMVHSGTAAIAETASARDSRAGAAMVVEAAARKPASAVVSCMLAVNCD